MYALLTALALSAPPAEPVEGPGLIGTTRLNRLRASQPIERVVPTTAWGCSVALLRDVVEDPQAFGILAELEKLSGVITGAGGGRVRFSVEIENDDLKDRLSAAAQSLARWKVACFGE